jgi:hypothetical protein
MLRGCRDFVEGGRALACLYLAARARRGKARLFFFCREFGVGAQQLARARRAGSPGDDCERGYGRTIGVWEERGKGWGLAGEGPGRARARARSSSSSPAPSLSCPGQAAPPPSSLPPPPSTRVRPPLSPVSRICTTMAPRVTYRTRSSYHTASNATRVVKTPGQFCFSVWRAEARPIAALSPPRAPLALLSLI